MNEPDDLPPAVFTPDNEPYLGREPLLAFDKQIPFSLWVSSHIAAYTRENPRASVICRWLPARWCRRESTWPCRFANCSDRLFVAALVLMRPLVERAAIISYLLDHPEAIEEWKGGWRFRNRPPLATMLHSMGIGEAYEEAKEICGSCNHITHGDPVAADSNAVPLGDGSLGYSVGKVLGNPALCDALATQGRSYLASWWPAPFVASPRSSRLPMLFISGGAA